MKKFNQLRIDLTEKTLTPAEKKKREEIAMAMERENPGMPMAKKMAIATAAAKRVAEEAELEEGIKSKIAGVALSALAAHGAAHSRVTPDGQGGFTGGLNPSPTVTAPASAPAAAAPIGFSREYLQGVVDGKHPRPLLSKEKAAEHLKNMKEDTEQVDELKSSTLDSYITKVATGPSRGNKNIKAIGGVTTAIRKKAENNNPPFDPDPPKENPSAVAGKYGIGPSIAAHLAKKGMKNVLNKVEVDEEVKTTYEDPLVVVKDSEGNILTHANRSVAGDIHGINVSPHTIHTGMPVEVVDRDGKKLTVQKSMHHDSEVAKDSASAVKEAKEKTEYDYEGDMARSQLQSIVMNAQKVHDMLKDNDNLPEWVQSKITLAEDYILTVSNYMATEIDEQTNKEYTHKVVNRRGDIVGKYTSLKTATRAADKKDNAYGGYAHQVRRIDEKTIEEASYTFEPATHTPTVKNSKGHSFEGNTYNAKGLKGASIYKNKDTGKYYANKIDSNTTFHSSAEDAAEKYHNKAK